MGITRYTHFSFYSQCTSVMVDVVYIECSLATPPHVPVHSPPAEYEVEQALCRSCYLNNDCNNTTKNVVSKSLAV